MDMKVAMRTIGNAFCRGHLMAVSPILALTCFIVMPNAAIASAAEPHASRASLVDGSNDNSTNQLEEVIVTAERRGESLSRVGVTVTTVSADTMSALRVNAPEDLPRFVPGFQATTTYAGNPVYALRGVGFPSHNQQSTSPIGVYLDEAAVPYPYMSTGLLFDLERVEVLKGPQGTLYGRNATGGLINYVTVKPTSEFTAGAALEYGNYDTLNANGFVSGPVSDGLRLRFAFDSQDRADGWQKSVSRDDELGELSQRAFRAIADIGNGGSTSAQITGSYWSRGGDPQAPQNVLYGPAFTGSPYAYPEAGASVIPEPSRNSQADWTPFSRQPSSSLGIIHPSLEVDSEFVGINFHFQYNLSEQISLVSLLNYGEVDHKNVIDVDGLAINELYYSVTGSIETISEEIRIIGTHDKFEWSAGIYHAEDKHKTIEHSWNDENAAVDSLRDLALTVDQDRFSPETLMNGFPQFEDRGRGTNEVKAIFANVDLKISDFISVTLGGRYTEDKLTNDACTYDVDYTAAPLFDTIYPLFVGHPVGPLTPNGCYTLTRDLGDYVYTQVRQEQEEDNFSWKARVALTPSNTDLIYLSASRGHQAGQFPVLAASVESQFDPVKQEELTAYELGYKTSLFAQRVQWNSSIFHYDYTNKQAYGRVADMIFGNLPRIRNIPKSRVTGAETNITWRVIDPLVVSLSAVYVDSEIEEYSDFNEFNVLEDYSGNSFVYTPEFQGNMLAVYTAQVNESFDLNATLGVSYQASSNASPSEHEFFRIKSYTLVDGAIGISSRDGWKVELYGKNLFDEYYWTNIDTATNSTLYRFTGMPRTFGIRVAVKM